MSDYQDLTDCPICPQLATDRDDALSEAEGLRAELAGKSAALRALASERRSCTPAERALIDAYLSVYRLLAADGVKCRHREVVAAELRLDDATEAVLAERGEA